MKNKRAILLILYYLIFLAFELKAQNSILSIDECYTAARENYPLIKQRDLIIKTKDLSLENASKGYLPQLNIFGQATYQSEVTTIPISIPGKDIPALTKDQYRIYGEITQPIFDGGIIKQQKQSIIASTNIEDQKIEIELYKLKDRINQLFFGILLIEEQIKQNDLLKTDIDEGIKKAQALVDNGASLKSNVSMLKAERLKLNQRFAELSAARKSYLEILAVFINRQLNEVTVLNKPPAVISSDEIRRPELTLFEYQHKALDLQNKLIFVKNLPKLNLFLQGGYGKPALNILKPEFSPYCIGGLRLNWNLTGFYTYNNEKSIVIVNRKLTDVQKELFLLNTSFIVKQQNTEITKLTELLTSDDEIIGLRQSIKLSSTVQLENGTITAGDFLRDVNAEDQARQNKSLHEIQLLMLRYNQKITTGN